MVIICNQFFTHFGKVYRPQLSKNKILKQIIEVFFKMLIDCHSHAFADKIADKAVKQLINYYQIPTNHGGRLVDLFTAANEADLDALVLLVAATFEGNRKTEITLAHE